MAALSFVLTALLLSVTFKGVNTAQITINPPSLTLSGNSSVSTVRFTCTPGTTVTPQEALYSLTISRVATGSTAQPTQLGSASQKNSNNGAAKMDTTITGATIEGSLSQQSITIIMTLVTCTDEATFVCTAAVFTPPTASFPTPADDRKNFTVDVSAGFVSMTQEPLLTTYQVNTTLTMRCNGLVGSNEPDAKIEWVWQYRDYQGFMYNDYSRKDDISQDSIVPDTIPCQYRQTSTLTRQISMEDFRREYRCFVRRGGVPSEPDAQHTATYLLGVVYEEEPPTDPNASGSTDNSAPAKANVGAIVGGVIGGLILIAIVVILVYFLVIRKRRQEAEAYSGDKPNEEPIPYIGGYPPSNNADVTYSKPNRFQKHSDRGVTNKGMDEPTRDEKPPGYEKKPDRYQNENDYRRGGRNPGYDHGEDRDTRNRRYSADDGGTDRDVNTSMHSISSRGTGDPTMGTAI